MELNDTDILDLLGLSIETGMCLVELLPEGDICCELYTLFYQQCSFFLLLKGEDELKKESIEDYFSYYVKMIDELRELKKP